MKQLHGTPLKRFLRDWRRAHPLVRDIVLVLQSVAYPVNVGSMFRIADAVGITRMFLCGITPTPEDSAKVGKVGRYKHTRVDWEYREETEDVLQGLHQEGYSNFALEITDSALPYFEAQYPPRLALVVGNEDHGVTRSALALCDSSIFVPMYGKGRSLNVHVSAAVALYHIAHQELIEDAVE